MNESAYNGTASAGRQRISFDRVSVEFPAARGPLRVVDDVSFSVADREFVAIIGPSGCGKTTMMNIVAGFVQPNSGTVLLDGKPIAGPGPDRGVIFQEYGVFPWLSVRGNIEFGLRLRANREHASERAGIVTRYMALMGLSDFADHFPKHLSGGMRQRVAIARALVVEPKVLLMDEPFAALDAQTRTLLHGQLQELWLKTHKSILFVTHSVGEAVRLADRIIVLHSHPGRIRREINVDLPHPRNFDSRDIGELVHVVRREIEDEVNRVNAIGADEVWKPQAAADLGSPADDLGSGI